MQKNSLLRMEHEWVEESNNSPFNRILPKNKEVHIKKIWSILNDLKSLKKYWYDNIEPILGIEPIVWVYHNKIVSKNNRIVGLFCKNKKKKKIISEIIGCKFYNNENENGNYAHVITYHLNLNSLNRSITLLDNVIKFMENNNLFKITNDHLNDEFCEKFYNFIDKNYRLKSLWKNLIVDCYYINKISHKSPNQINNFHGNQILSFYKTSIPMVNLLSKIGINVNEKNKLDDHSFYFSSDDTEIIKEKLWFLISMNVKSTLELELEEPLNKNSNYDFKIQKPNNEPIVGVIDTKFDNDVYFNEWVEFIDKTEKFEKNNLLITHGTEVTSIIVDGPKFNPKLDDGCGNFRVRHFGVTNTNELNVFDLIHKIDEIVKENKDIKVWNISLGTTREINNDFISLLGAQLDYLQANNDIIFVVCGSNNKNIEKTNVRLGSPGDSINGIVVNSCKKDHTQTSYARCGNVLSFFNKPDVSYYGGDIGEPINTYSLGQIYQRMGTSFATPWITRKIAYMIHVLKMSREEAKALLINSALSIDKKTEKNTFIGHGIVPIKINDIVSSNNDEIKFLITGTAKKYKMSIKELAIPKRNEKTPYAMKITLCYFTDCNRFEGVDYTSRELNITFGHINKNDNEITPINENKQDSMDGFVFENKAREFYEKWNNVKNIVWFLKTEKKNKSRDGIKNNGELWGIKLTKKNRDDYIPKKDIKFAIVVTLQNIKKINRIGEFCNLNKKNNWTIQPINIEQNIDNNISYELKLNKK